MNIMETGHAPRWICYWQIQFVLATLVEGHLVIISTKLLWPPVSQEKNFLKYLLSQ